MRLVLMTLVAAVVFSLPQAQAQDQADTDATIEMAVGAAAEVLALGDLCNWNFSLQSEKLFQEGAKALRLNAAQQKDMRARVAAARQATFGHFSTAGQARLRADVCRPEERLRLETAIGRISFE
jgi:hypothetical protein